MSADTDDLQAKVEKKIFEALRCSFSAKAEELIDFSTDDDEPIDIIQYHVELPTGNSNKQYSDSASFGDGRDSPEVKRLSQTDKLESHIHRRLGHIAVNPRDKYNTDALIKAYCYTGTDRVQDPTAKDYGEITVANGSRENAKYFVDRLVEIAKEQAKILATTVDSQGKAMNAARATLLFGPNGAGKTFFLNHLLSTYNTYLDERKVIWVRVSVVNDLGYDDRLQDWINAQAAKIILRYYNERSWHFTKPIRNAIDIERYFRETVLSQKSKADRAKIIEELQRARQIFEEGGAPETGVQDAVLSDKVISPRIANWVIAAAHKSGYSFICAIDGLDLMEITRSYRRRFDKIVAQSMELVNSKKRTGMGMLIVTRTGTLKNILKPDFKDTFDNAQVGEFALDTIPLRKVLTQRLEYVAQEIPILEVAGQLRLNAIDFREHLSDFSDFLYASDGEHSEAPGAFLDSLERIQGGNLRAKMHMLQYKYFEFVSMLPRKAVSYRAVEALMKAGRRLPPVAYRYVLTENGVLRVLGSQQKYDSRFLPSLFRFPFPLKKVPARRRSAFKVADKGWRVDTSYILIVLRLIQLLDLNQKYPMQIQPRSRGIPQTNLNVGDVMTQMNYLFGYNRDAVLASLEELYEHQIIEFENSNLTFENSQDMEDNEIVCLPKLELLLNRLTSDVAYLNMSAMRLPLPHRAFKDMEVPFVDAASLDTDADTFERWIVVKITNVISVIRLFGFLNRRQEIRVQRLSAGGWKQAPEHSRFYDFCLAEDMFSLHSKVSQAAEDQLQRIIASIKGSHDLAAVSARLDSYISEWC